MKIVTCAGSLALAAAVMAATLSVATVPAQAAVMLTIERDSDTSATFIGSGALDVDLLFMPGFFVEGALATTLGPEATVVGDLGLGGNSIDAAAGNFPSEIAMFFDSAVDAQFDFAVGETLSGSSTITFVNQVFAPVGSTGDIIVFGFETADGILFDDDTPFVIGSWEIVAPAPIPVPAAGVLLLAGLAALGAVRRRAK
ncbi:MAG: VPLPA-CTERM sorting domain-containing protein [Pseudomonadota bacterium]